LAPLRQTYLVELSKLKTEFTKAGDLKAALMVEEEIKALQTAMQRSDKSGSSRVAAQPSTASSDGRPLKPIGTTEPRILKDFPTVEAFQDWLMSTEWLSKDEAYMYAFPERGQQKLTHLPSGDVSTREIRITKVGKVEWGTTNVIEMTVDGNLREAVVVNRQGRDPKEFKRTKP